MRNTLPLILFLLFACHKNKPSHVCHNLFDQGNSDIALVFIAPDCPLCETLSYDFVSLQKKYPKVKFYGIVSGSYYNDEEIKQFVDKNGFSIPIIKDTFYEIAHRLKPTRTPEFYLVDRNGKIVYQGLLDNRMEALGVFRTVTTAFYLDSALSQFHIQKRKPTISRTKAIGCTFEY